MVDPAPRRVPHNTRMHRTLMMSVMTMDFRMRGRSQRLMCFACGGGQGGRAGGGQGAEDRGQGEVRETSEGEGEGEGVRAW